MIYNVLKEELCTSKYNVLADERVFSKEVKMMLSGNASGFCLWDMPDLTVERAWHSIAVTPTHLDSGIVTYASMTM